MVVVRQRRKYGVAQSIVVHRIFGRMRLIVAVLRREYREKHVALHEKVGIGILAEHRLVEPRHHVLLCRILLVVSLHIEYGRTIERRYLEHVAPAVARKLRSAHHPVRERHFRLDHHLMLQSAVVDPIGGVGLANPHILDICLRHEHILCVVAVVRTGQSAVVAAHHIVQPYRRRGIDILVYLDSRHSETIGPRLYLVRLHLVERQHLIYRALNRQRPFRSIAPPGASRVGQFGPLVSAPSLHHHQHIERLGARRVVGREIVSRIGYESFQFAAEQHVGHDIAVIVCRVVGGGIAHSHGKQCRPGHTVTLHADADFLVRRIRPCPAALYCHAATVVVVVVDEEQTVGNDTPAAVKQRNVVDTRGQVGRQRHRSAAVGPESHFTEMAQHSAAHHRHAVTAIGRQIARTYIQHASRKLYSSPRRLRLRQIERIFLAAAAETCLQTAGPGCHREHPPAHISRHGVGHSGVAVGDTPRNRHGCSGTVGQFECHAARHALYHPPALGIESGLKSGLGRLDNMLLRPAHHLLVGIVAGLGRPGEYGQYARVQPVPRAEIVGRHIAAVEQVGIVLAVALMGNVEVEHPPCVRPQLIVARIERVGQGKLSAAVAVGTDDNVLALHKQAVGREQFHIDHAADVGISEIVGPRHICLIPYRVAHEIACIVDMHIHLFLGLRVGRRFKCHTYIIKRAGLRGNRQRQQCNDEFKDCSFH